MRVICTLKNKLFKKKTMLIVVTLFTVIFGLIQFYSEDLP